MYNELRFIIEQIVKQVIEQIVCVSYYVKLKVPPFSKIKKKV